MQILTAMLDVLAAEAPNVPNPGPQQPPGTGGVSDVLGWVRWIALAVCVGSLMAVGALMAVPSLRERAGDAAGKVVSVLGGVIIISAAGALVGFLA